MRKITIDDLIVELDNASKLASECGKPSAMIAATLAKAESHLDNEVQSVQVNTQFKDGRNYD